VRPSLYSKVRLFTHTCFLFFSFPGEMCGEGTYISNGKRSGRKESTKATLIKGHFNHNEFQQEEENGKQETYLNDNEEYVSGSSYWHAIVSSP
jgi:hypothetical protein